MCSPKDLRAHSAAGVALLVVLYGVLAGCVQGIALQPGRRALLFRGRPTCSDRNFAAVQACARKDARIDLDPLDRGDASRHWQLVAAPGGTLRIQSTLRSTSRPPCASFVTAAASCAVNTVSLGAAASSLNAWKIDCTSLGKGCAAYLPARNGCPKRYLGYSTACGTSYMALFRLGEQGAITRFDALAPEPAPVELELMFPAGLGLALQGSPPGTAASVLDLSISHIGETYVAVASPINGFPVVYKYKSSPSLQWELVGGGYASFTVAQKLWLFSTPSSGELTLAFLTAAPTRLLVKRISSGEPWRFSAQDLSPADAIWDVAPSVAMPGDSDDRVMAAVQVADPSGEGITVYTVTSAPGTSSPWRSYDDKTGARLVQPNPGRSPFVLTAARPFDPDAAVAYLATTSSASNPGCLAVRQLRGDPRSASWVAPGGNVANPACIADLLPTNPAPGTLPIPAPMPALFASRDSLSIPAVLYLAYRATDGAVQVVSATYNTFSNAQWKQLGRARVTDALPTTAPPELAVDSIGVPYVGTLLGGGPGASVYRFSGGDWQLVSRPGSLKAYSTLRLDAGLKFDGTSKPGPLRVAFDDADNEYKASVWRLYDPSV